MIPVKVILISSVMLLMFRHANAAAGDIADVCKTDGTCGGTGILCDPVDFHCKVQADTAATDCADDNTKCVSNAVCAPAGGTDPGTCSCEAGYTESSDHFCTVIGDTCTSNTDCSTKITNSYCQIRSPCSKGTCECSSGYSGVVCTTLTYDMGCSSSNDQCDTTKNLECSNSKCACKSSAGSWNSDVNDCTAKKTFGESCPTDHATDCYPTVDGDCISSLCTCKAGYVQYTSGTTGAQSCRRPFAGESTCTTNVGCDKLNHAYISGSETSQQNPTCSAAGTCGCAPSGETEYMGAIGSATCYRYCLTTLTSTKANGETCTTHNECHGKLCMTCPGDTAATCYTGTCGAEAVNAVLMSVLLTVAAVKFLF